MLERARQFLFEYQLPKNKNLGAHIFFLKFLKENNLIASNFNHISLRDFIKANVDVFKNFDFLSFINQDFSFKDTEYFLKIQSIMQGAFDMQQLEHFNDIFLKDELANQFLRQYDDQCPAYAFEFDLEVESGSEECARRFAQCRRSNLSPIDMFKQLDHLPENAVWPYTKVFDNIFALTGFSEKYKSYFSAAGFFYTLLENNIQYVLALGNAGDTRLQGIDFPPYFLEERQYVHTVTGSDVEFSVKVVPLKHSDEFGEFSQHTLRCDFETFNPKTNEKICTSKEVTVLHVPMLDGQPINLKMESRLKLFPFLRQEIQANKSVAAHCQAGRGRTGAAIFELSAPIDYFFEVDDKKIILERIRTFLMQGLREKRIGMPLETIQLWTALVNLYNETLALQNNKRKVSNDEFVRDLAEQSPTPAKKMKETALVNFSVFGKSESQESISQKEVPGRKKTASNQ